MTQRIAILGASGYTGAELARLIATHPSMKITALSGDRKAGMAMGDVFPHLRHMGLPDLVKIEEIDFSQIDRQKDEKISSLLKLLEGMPS